jgi:hypothetical protein
MKGEERVEQGKHAEDQDEQRPFKVNPKNVAILENGDKA